jgi:hypothetical protein
MKVCGDKCKHCQPYNEEWCVCWNRLIKGSRVQMGIQCTVEKVKEDIERKMP